MIFPGAQLSSCSSSIKKEELSRNGDQSPDLRSSPPPPPYPVNVVNMTSPSTHPYHPTFGPPAHDHLEQAPQGRPHHGHRGRRCGSRGGPERCQRKCRDRRRHLFRRVFVRFVVFVTVSMLYIHAERVQSAWAVVVNHTPDFLVTVFSFVGHLLAMPLAVSQTMGVIFYSALAAFLLTAMHVKIKRRKMMRWHARWNDAARARHGQAHDHEAWPAHHGRHGRHAWHSHHSHGQQACASVGYQHLPQEDIMVPHSPQGDHVLSDSTFVSDAESHEK